MNLINAIIKPDRLDAVKEALQDIGVAGMTAMEVRGYGRQKGHSEIYRGAEYDIGFVPKIMIMLAASEGQVPQILETIQETARTGKIGDGKIFVSPLSEAVRIRTGESGAEAI
jgi:nitrogen regulatory protein P-II 1